MMGPGVGPRPPAGIRGPGGFGAPTRPPMTPRGAGPGAFGGPIGPRGQPAGGFMRPGGFGPAGAGRPGGDIPFQPGRPGDIGIGGPRGPGGALSSASWPRVGGLDALARTNAFARTPSTFHMSQQALANVGNRVTNNFNFSDCFNGNWWNRHSNAWSAYGWGKSWSAYGTVTWSSYSDYCGYSRGYYYPPIYYDYGTTVVYQGDRVYVNGDSVGTQEQYTREATVIADRGRRAEAGEQEEWLPLGVFVMIQGEQVNGNDLFQLAVNKAGVIRGNYYNTITDTALPVYGSVDHKTQRAAWTIGERQEPVFEAGVANLTKSQTTMLVHFRDGRTQQWILVRIESPATSK